MKPFEILTNLINQGIKLKAIDGKLNVQAQRGIISSEIQKLIKENKNDIIQILERLESKSEIEITPEKKYYSLSSAQKRIYFLHEFGKDSLAYNLPQCIKITGNLDKDRLKKVFDKLITHHESLRTSFKMVDGEPVQKILKKIIFSVACFQTEEAEVQDVINDFIQPFDLNEAPLFRVGLIQIDTGVHILMVDIHHIITDGVSQAILFKDFIALYNKEKLRNLKIQYKDYSEWQQKQQKKIRHQEHFWREEFSEELAALELPLDNPRPLTKNYSGNRIGFSLDNSQTDQLKAIGDMEGATLFMTTLAIFNILLSKLSNQEDIVVGTPVAGRQNSDIEGIIGMFVNTLAIRNYPKSTMSFREFLAVLKRKTLACLEYQAYQYEDLIEALQTPRNASRNPLFDVMFGFENFGEGTLQIPGLKFESYRVSQQASKFDLTLTVNEEEDKLYFTFTYATALFNVETIQRFVDYFKRIVLSVCKNPDVRLSVINILSEKERQRLLYEFNDTKVDYSTELSIIDLFEIQVKKSHQKIALIFEDNELSYEELNTKTNLLASHLIREGLVSGEIIPIYMERSIEMVIAILGILKGGGAYLPLDPTFPDSHIFSIIRDFDANFVLMHSSQENKFQSFDRKLQVIHVDKLQEGENLSLIELPPICLDQLTYLIYTSGSTGTPKGVMNAHGGILNRLLWMQKDLSVTHDDVFIQKTPYVFDVSVWEFLLPLISGSTLVIAKPNGHKNSDYLQKLIRKHQISIIHFVPSMLSAFLIDIKPGLNSSLKHIICSGEELKYSTFSEFKTTFKAVTLRNYYGPTEAAIDVTAIDLTDHEGEKIPIGKPVANTQIYIVDNNLNLVPEGVVGELLIGGVQVAQGYLNREKLTAEKFIGHPFSEDDMFKVYKTGDLARWLSNGNIEFLGRIDNQVKIRGHRIELGEIASRLEAFEGIDEVIVITNNKKEDTFLVVYYTANTVLRSNLLKDYLHERLPNYMIPNIYIKVESIPVSTNGKLDRKALPEYEIPNDKYIAPRHELEKKLVEIWANVLEIEVDKLGVTNDFFDLGGHSLSSLKLIQNINLRLGVSITIDWIFECPTVEKISERIIKLYSLSAGLNKRYKELEQPKTVKIAEIEKSGKSRQLFFCAPLGGTIPSTSLVGLMDMGSYLKEVISFFTVQAPALFPEIHELVIENKDVDLKTWDYDFLIFEEIIEQTVKKVISYQQDGEFILGGFCSGCILAVEVSNRLKKLGKKVSNLILVDPPLWMTSPRDITKIDYQYTIDEVATFMTKDIDWKAGLDKEEFINEMNGKSKEYIWEISRNILLDKEILSQDVELKDLKRAFFNKFYNDKVLTIFFALNKFKVSKTIGDTNILLLVSEHVVDIKDADTIDYIKNHVATSFELRYFKGENHTLFQEKFLQIWALEINKFLTQKELLSVD